MATTMIPQWPATPARWQAALGRAIAEGVQVRQLAGSGLWLATSGTDAGTAYALAVTGDVAHGCECPAAAHGDPVCKHRAAFYHTVGVLDPEPPTLAAPTAFPCSECHGTGTERVAAAGRWFMVACLACDGAGTLRPLALRLDAQVTAGFLEGDLQSPALDEPGRDRRRGDAEVGAKQRLGAELPLRVADQHPAQGHRRQAGVGPDRRAGGDLDRALAGTVPVRHHGSGPNGGRVGGASACYPGRDGRVREEPACRKRDPT